MTDPEKTGKVRPLAATPSGSVSTAPAPVNTGRKRAAAANRDDNCQWRWPAPDEPRLGPRRYTRLVAADDMRLDRAAGWSRMSVCAFIRRAIRQELERAEALMQAERVRKGADTPPDNTP